MYYNIFFINVIIIKKKLLNNLLYEKITRNAPLLEIVTID